MNEIFKKAFDNVRPADELVDGVLQPQNFSVKTKSKSFSIKRVFCAVAAVCAVLVCGISAAAAVGLIDFDSVFGSRITVKDSELASSLVGTVSGFKYKVSDKDYKIEIKGVTGNDKKAIAIAEISRVDGTPVADRFVNSTDDNQFVPLWENAEILNTYTGGYSIDHRVNEAGNIELYIDWDSEDGIDGKKIICEGENFYPAGAYINFKYNNANEDICTECTQYGESSGDKDSGGGNDEPEDISDILALGLKWEFSFIYRQSDKSQQVKSLNAPEESFPLTLNVHIVGTKEDFIRELIAQPTYIEAGSTGGRVDFEYEMTGYESNHDYSVNYSDNADIYISLKNGERIYGTFGGGVCYPDGDVYKCSFNIVYWDKNNYTSVFTDVENITAISINGTVYELK